MSEFIDDETYRLLEIVFRDDHPMRCLDLAVLTCKMLGLTGRDAIASVRRGALLHDIGKARIPSSVRHKPGRLTEREWQWMRKHCEYGAEIMQILGMNGDATIALGHHERWDGTGYPRGLTGLDIPLAARAFAPIDVYDALRSVRYYPRYRADGTLWTDQVRGLTHAEAMEIVVAGSGSQFDPAAVSAFAHAIILTGSEWPDARLPVD